MNTPVPAAKSASQEPLVNTTTKDSNPASHAAQSKQPAPEPPSEAPVFVDAAALPPTNSERSAAFDKVAELVNSYPTTAPDSHVVFGYGSIRVTLGDMRAIFG